MGEFTVRNMPETSGEDCSTQIRMLKAIKKILIQNDDIMNSNLNSSSSRLSDNGAREKILYAMS